MWTTIRQQTQFLFEKLMVKLSTNLFGCVVFFLASTALGQSSDLQFSAKQILPAAIIQTATYRINDVVSVVDHQFHFNIETSYGVFSVTSIPLLEKRLSELRAIEEAVKLSGERVAAKSAWESLKQTPRGAGHLLSDPRGTLRQIPRGFERAAANFIDPVSRHAGTETHRKIAANLGVDSETRNPVLKQVIGKLATRNFVGSTATKFALSAAVPGLGTLSAMEDTRNAIATRSPHELLVEMDAELTRLGAWKPVKDAFVTNQNWTLLEKLTFMDSYRKLAGVQQPDTMIYLANQDVTESDILRRLIEIQLLANLHSVSPVKSVFEFGLPIAFLQNGEIVGIFSTDYLTNSQQAQQIASGFRQKYPSKALKLYSTGYVSPAAQQTLDANKIEFLRAGFAAQVNNNQPVQQGSVR